MYAMTKPPSSHSFFAMAAGKQTRKEIPPEMLELGKRLKKAIKARKTTAADLARDSKTSPDQISRTINGETLVGIEAQTVAKWAKSLRVRLDWLVLKIEPMDLEDAVRVYTDGSRGVDEVADLVAARLRERGLAVKVHGAATDEDSDD